MPAWGHNLDNRQIDALLVYLLGQFEWDDEEEDE